MGVLRLSGIVRVEAGRLRPRNEIYRRAFDREWVRQNMPDAERRARDDAFRRGVYRTASLATAVVLLFGVMTYWALRSANEARIREAESSVTEAGSLRKGHRAGRQLGAWAALRHAAGNYRDKDRLRDEVIAALAPVDVASHAPGMAWTAALPVGSPQALSPGLSHLAWADADGGVHLRALSATASDPGLQLPPIGMPVRWLGVGSKGIHVAVQYADASQERFVLWNMVSGAKLIELPLSVKDSAVDFDALGNTFAVGYRESPQRAVIRVLNLVSGQDRLNREVEEATGIAREPDCVRLDASGGYLAESSRSSHYVGVWNLATGQREKQLYHRGDVVAMTWSADSRQLATASLQHSIYVWYLPMDWRHEIPKAHAGPILDLAFSDDGSLLGSVSEDMTLKVWVPAIDDYVSHALGAAPGRRLYFEGGGRRFGMTGDGGVPRFWKVAGFDEFQVHRCPAGYEVEIRDFGFAPDNRLLWVAHDAGGFLWDGERGGMVATLDHKAIRYAFFHANTRGEVRTYVMSWSNPYPDVEIKALDFVSTQTESAPFLLAVTVDPP